MISKRSISSRFLRPWAATAALCAALIALGCGGGAKKNAEVTGKVTLSGQPVAGEVVFVGGDGKEQLALLNPEGVYTTTALAKGEYQVAVRGMAAPPAPAGKAPPPPAGSQVPETPKTGVAPPAKYAKPSNGLKVTITGEPQTYDIPLTP